MSVVGPKVPISPQLEGLLRQARAGHLQARRTLAAAGHDVDVLLLGLSTGTADWGGPFQYGPSVTSGSKRERLVDLRTWCPVPNVFPKDLATSLQLLEEAPITPLRPMGVGTNRPMRVYLGSPEGPSIEAVMKRESHEFSPWRDFIGPLAVREAAVFALDLALGLGAVPPTILRAFPGGERASLQLLITDARPGPLAIPHGTVASDKLRIFDVIIGSRDRSGLNCLFVERGGQLFAVAIDNGNCLQRTGEDDARRYLAGAVVPAAVEWLMSIDPQTVANVLAEFDIERNAAADALRRLLALQAQPDLMASTLPLNAPIERVEAYLVAAYGARS